MKIVIEITKNKTKTKEFKKWTKAIQYLLNESGKDKNVLNFF